MKSLTSHLFKPLLFYLLICGFVTKAQTQLTFAKSTLPNLSSNYCIQIIQDFRPIQNTIGNIIINQKSENLTLISDLPKALKKHLPDTYFSNKTGFQILIKIQAFNLIEKQISPQKIEGKFRLKFIFEIIRDEQTSVFLTEYSGGNSILRSPNAILAYQQSIAMAIDKSIIYFDKWIKTNEKIAPQLAQFVKIKFINPQIIQQDDTVFYPKHLSWADFRASAANKRKYQASVFTSFSYEGNATVQDGIIVLEISTKTYMLKEGSWAMDIAKNDPESLIHEQRHFDISQIATNRFKKTLSIELFSIDDYNSQVQYLFLEAYREHQKLQEQYDTETNHGQNSTAQNYWNNWIDAQLGLK